jgi:spore maturation protein CgeB
MFRNRDKWFQKNVAVQKWIDLLMLNVLFFRTKTFLNKEMENSLKKRHDLTVLCVDIPVQPQPEMAPHIFEQLKPHLPAIIITLNDAGFDLSGDLGKLVSQTGSLVVNWYYDDPLYERIMHKRVYADLANRIDFVSEQCFVQVLLQKGHDTHFLPLAVDPAYFNTSSPFSGYQYDISFTGNSSLEFMDNLITPAMQKDIDNCKDLLVNISALYRSNPRIDLASHLLGIRNQWAHKIASSHEQFVFCMVWLAGYFYRKDFVVGLAKTFEKRFVCFGDIYWTNFIDKSQVSTDAMYYKNLCRYYRSCKVNININRIQTQTSFTQRVFDCKASGAFLLTDKRELNGRYFVTSGENAELIEYESFDHCKKLVRYYLEHDAEREAIAMRGREKVMEQHTYDNRVKEMMGIVYEKIGMG